MRLRRRQNVVTHTVSVKVKIISFTAKDAADCLEDIRREVDRVANRKVLRKRYNGVWVITEEAQIEGR